MAEHLSTTSIVPNAEALAEMSIAPITDAAIQNSIVPIAEALAQKIGLSLPGNDAVKEAGALLAFEAIKSATEVLFPTVAVGMTFNPTGFTLASIQKKLDDISDKLDTLLEKDYHSALDFLGDAMTSLEHHYYEDANEDFKKVRNKATDAYNCVKNDDIKLIQVSKMKMFCYIATKSYDEESKNFIPYELLPQRKKKLVSKLVRDQIEKLLKDLTTVKVRSDVKKFFKTKTQQEEIDNTMSELNTCLKSASDFVQSSTPWNAPTGVIQAIQDFSKADRFVAGTVITESVDVNTIKHIKMIKSDFEINQKGGPDRGTSLFYASKFGNVDVVDALLEANADQNVCDEDGNSPLMVASQKGHVQIVTKLLLQENTDINKRGQLGRTALFYACNYGKEDVVDVLLDAKADQNVCHEYDNSPLMMASQEGHVQIVTKLLLQENTNVNKRGQHGRTALWHACNDGKEDVVDVLLDAKADQNVCAPDGNSPLMVASEKGHVQIVTKLLLQENNDVNKKGDYGRNALHYACWQGKEGVVDALLEAKADHNICDGEDNSPLMVASHWGHVQIVTKLLLQENIDVNKRGDYGRTALFYACLYEKEDVVDVLLDANADPNICSFSGWNPLMIASQWGHSQIVQKLLQRNTDISKKNDKGETALSVARKHKHDEVVAILENFISEKRQSTGNQ